MANIYKESEIFDGIDFSASFEKGVYDGCTFRHCTFARADLSRVEFADCVFEDCDMSMANVRSTAFKEVQFKGCKLLGVRFDECHSFLLAFQFEGCLLELASFYQLKLKGINFTNCQLKEVDFTETDLTKAVFANCDLSKAIFAQTNLEQADLRTAEGFSINPEINRLQKARFSRQNIIGLLDKYNIKVE